MAVLVVAAVLAVLATRSGGGASSAAGFKVDGLAVYGPKGAEGIPLEVAPVLAPPDPALRAGTVDGISCGATEQTSVHFHVHLQVFVGGRPRAVPAGVGMVPPAVTTRTGSAEYAEGSTTCLFWLHTHAQDGVIHIEAPATRTFVLRQFFDIWGQAITDGQVGPARGRVTATVDGAPYTGDPGEIALGPRRQIVLNVGGPVAVPPPVSFAGTNL